MQTEELKLYPTIIHRVEIPEMLPFHDQIVEIVLSLVVPGDINKIIPGQPVGHQTKPVLFDRSEEGFSRLKGYHEAALRRYLQTDPFYRGFFPNQEVPEHRSVCWAYAQNEAQQSSYLHHHGASGVSAVYYVKCPENLESPQGCISFADPRGAGITSLLGSPLPSEGFLQSPKEGMMLLFPSWLQHRPMPMTGSSGWRISLGIDTNFLFRIGAGFRAYRTT